MDVVAQEARGGVVLFLRCLSDQRPTGRQWAEGRQVPMMNAPSRVEPFSVRVRVVQRWVIVAVAGELDVATAPELATHADRLVSAGRLRVALELSQLTFCDSSGLGVIVGIWRRLRRAGGEFVLVNPQERVVQLLRRTGLEGRLTVWRNRHADDTRLRQVARADVA
ncbi:MAG TPA: STAS domain-containing protein [Streptosporangiaceae bacterium]